MRRSGGRGCFTCVHRTVIDVSRGFGRNSSILNACCRRRSRLVVRMICYSPCAAPTPVLGAFTPGRISADDLTQTARREMALIGRHVRPIRRDPALRASLCQAVSMHIESRRTRASPLLRPQTPPTWGVSAVKEPVTADCSRRPLVAILRPGLASGSTFLERKSLALGASCASRWLGQSSSDSSSALWTPTAAAAAPGGPIPSFIGSCLVGVASWRCLHRRLGASLVPRFRLSRHSPCYLVLDFLRLPPPLRFGVAPPPQLPRFGPCSTASLCGVFRRPRPRGALFLGGTQRASSGLRLACGAILSAAASASAASWRPGLSSSSTAS